MIQTKKKIADRVISRLQNAYPNIDFRAIRMPYVYVIVDDIINSLARQNYFQNWKLTMAGLDECFITTWEGDAGIDVVDPEEDQSYIELPATPVALPMNNGVQEVWPQNFEYGSVRLRQHSEIRRTRNLMSGNMQGELGGCLVGTKFKFDQTDVGKNFSQKMNLRLAVKDSTAIAENAPFPVAADLLEEIIERAYIYLSGKREELTDTIRDSNDGPNRN
jgi:hypothetical protein